MVVMMIIRVVLPVLANVMCIILPGFLSLPAILLPILPVPLEVSSRVLALSLRVLALSLRFLASGL
jgi:hypothetical protein